jgi:hypothetical protein
MGNGPTGMVRAFGVEAHYLSIKSDDKLADSPLSGNELSSSFRGFAVGISPISLGTDRDGPSAVSFTWLEPYALLRFGTARSNGVAADHTHTAAVLGKRFALAIRLGLDIGVDKILSDGGAGYSAAGGTSLHAIGWPYAGLGYGAP